MCLMYLYTFNLSSSLSVLWGISLLVFLLAAGLWLIVVGKLRTRSYETPSENTGSTSLRRGYSRPPSAAKIGLLCIIACGGTIGYVRILITEHPVYEYHDLQVLQIVSPYSWMLKKDDGVFRADFCFDYDVSKLNPKPGETIDTIKYEDRGCWSIARKDLGIWWKKDSAGHTIGDN